MSREPGFSPESLGMLLSMLAILGGVLAWRGGRR